MRKNALTQFKKSCERMRKMLRDAEALAANALAHQPENTGDCWRHLSAALYKLRAMMRPKPHTLAWHTEIDYYMEHEPNLRWFVENDGKYFTPKEALDVVIANPPMGTAKEA